MGIDEDIMIRGPVGPVEPLCPGPPQQQVVVDWGHLR